MRFQEWWDRFVEDMLVTTREWERSRRPELLATSRLWHWIVDKDPDQVTGEDIADLRSTYLSLPRNYHRRRGYADQSARKLAEDARAADPSYERVVPKTFNKHLSTLKAFFGWLKRQRKLPSGFEDPFDGLAVKIRKRGRAGRRERDAYTLGQIAVMFSGPVWTGRLSARSISRPGKCVVKDSLYWVPLMCAYLGMRREEACQLLVRHVVRIADIWVIDLNAPDLRLKESDGDESEGSRRWLPLHDDLLRLEFVDTLVGERGPAEQLFPELDTENAHSAFGVSVGKRFKHYQRQVHPDWPHGLHRFRHTFSTVLENIAAAAREAA